MRFLFAQLSSRKMKKILAFKKSNFCQYSVFKKAFFCIDKNQILTVPCLENLISCVDKKAN